MVSTNIIDMPNLTSRDALFCDYNGRISDYGTIYTISGKVLLISSAAQHEITRRTLVDGTSWDEDCEILIADNAIFRISIFSRDSHDMFSELGINYQAAEANQLIESGDHLFVKYESSLCERLDILVKSDNVNSIKSLLSELDYVEISSERWEMYRIMLGDVTINDALGNLPEEMGLGTLVSNDKGCYPGQEIHARIESRGKTVKNFCRLTGTSPLEIGKHSITNFGSISVSSSIFKDGITHALALIRLGESPTEVVQIDGNDFSMELLSYP
jgi:folate-binding protein YgfZ